MEIKNEDYDSSDLIEVVEDKTLLYSLILRVQGSNIALPSYFREVLASKPDTLIVQKSTLSVADAYQAAKALFFKNGLSKFSGVTKVDDKMTKQESSFNGAVLSFNDAQFDMIAGIPTLRGDKTSVYVPTLLSIWASYLYRYDLKTKTVRPVFPPEDSIMKKLNEPALFAMVTMLMRKNCFGTISAPSIIRQKIFEFMSERMSLAAYYMHYIVVDKDIAIEEPSLLKFVNAALAKSGKSKISKAYMFSPPNIDNPPVFVKEEKRLAAIDKVQTTIGGDDKGLASMIAGYYYGDLPSHVSKVMPIVSDILDYTDHYSIKYVQIISTDVSKFLIKMLLVNGLKFFDPYNYLSIPEDHRAVVHPEKQQVLVVRLYDGRDGVYTDEKVFKCRFDITLVNRIAVNEHYMIAVPLISSYDKELADKTMYLCSQPHKNYVWIVPPGKDDKMFPKYNLKFPQQRAQAAMESRKFYPLLRIPYVYVDPFIKIRGVKVPMIIPAQAQLKKKKKVDSPDSPDDYEELAQRSFKSSTTYYKGIALMPAYKKQTFSRLRTLCDNQDGYEVIYKVIALKKKLLPPESGEDQDKKLREQFEALGAKSEKDFFERLGVLDKMAAYSAWYDNTYGNLEAKDRDLDREKEKEHNDDPPDDISEDDNDTESLTLNIGGATTTVEDDEDEEDE